MLSCQNRFRKKEELGALLEGKMLKKVHIAVMQITFGSQNPKDLAYFDVLIATL